MSDPNNITTMNDQQIDDLSDLLDTYGISQQGMNLEAMDGFLSGIAVSPIDLSATQWEPKIWGGKLPPFKSPEEAEAASALIHRHLAMVQDRVKFNAEDIPEDLTPLMWLPDEVDFKDAQADELEVGADWSLGFFTAVSLAETEWDQALDDQEWIEEIFSYLDQLASGELLNEEDPSADGLQVSFKERMEIISALPSMLQDLAQYRAQRVPRQVLQ